MVCHTGFPKLTSLTIRNLPELNEIIIREGDAKSAIPIYCRLHGVRDTAYGH
ncbi:hypothetical protein CFP56_011484 [Quercus suber]|uniref:Uncharacterized protein n=1 Tax=Quercus suber TaxID=58331 RepID=A0AAW0M664_QUESU